MFVLEPFFLFFFSSGFFTQILGFLGFRYLVREKISFSFFPLFIVGSNQILEILNFRNISFNYICICTNYSNKS